MNIRVAIELIELIAELICCDSIREVEEGPTDTDFFTGSHFVSHIHRTRRYITDLYDSEMRLKNLSEETVSEFFCERIGKRFDIEKHVMRLG